MSDHLLLLPLLLEHSLPGEEELFSKGPTPTSTTNHKSLGQSEDEDF